MSRNQAIDALRGISIILVLLLHFNLAYHIDQSALNSVIPAWQIRRIAYNGNYGVTIFFVISGYLITSISLKRYQALSSINIIDFYIRRLSRIMPCLLLAMGIIITFSYIGIKIFQNTPDSTTMLVTIISIMTFWHNVLMEKVGYYNYCLNIFWSLSVEEMFYFTFPLLCLTLRKTKYLISFLLLLILIAPLYRYIHRNNEIIALYGYLSCFDAIAMGCMAAILAGMDSIKDRYIKYFLSLSALCIALVYVSSGILNNIVFGPSLIAIFTAIYLTAASHQTAMNPQKNAWKELICAIGKSSYELYLFHIIILALAKQYIDQNQLNGHTKILLLAIYLVVSSIAATVIAYLYSDKINKSVKNALLNLKENRLQSEPNI